MQRLADHLSTVVDRRVVDRTGLAGDFDLDLEWMPEANVGGAAVATLSSNLPSLFTAIQEQLGLKLEQRRENVPELVIEHIELPTAN